MSTEALVKRLVLDVLKPREPQIYVVAAKIASCKGVVDVSIALAEIDQSTESIKVSIEGEDIDIDEVKRGLEELGASVHSFDEVRVRKANLE